MKKCFMGFCLFFFFNELNDLIHAAKMYLMRSLANSEHLLSMLLLLTVVIRVYVCIYICQVLNRS